MLPSLQDVRQALRLADFDTTAAQSRMKPAPRPMLREPQRAGKPRQGAVLLLLYNNQDAMHFVLIRRREDLSAHAGQIALPGGRREAGETLAQAALRETHEEIGIDPQKITLLGELGSLYISPSDFEVYPFVGWFPQKAVFVPQLSEVAEIIEAPLSHLLHQDARQEEVWRRRGVSYQVPYFHIMGHKVWGATAMMLGEFVERLRVHCSLAHSM